MVPLAYAWGMILSFVMDNFRSFSEPAVLDLQETSFRRNIPADKDWTSVTHRMAGIFGPNAGGKTNIIRGLSQLSFAVAHSLRDPDITRALRDPHSLRRDSSTHFQTEYVAEKVRFRWFLELNDSGIVLETLEANETGHWRGIFKRSAESITFGPNARIPRAARENIEEFLSPWTLTLSAWRIVRSSGPYSPAASWWLNNISIIQATGDISKRHANIVNLIQNNVSWLKLAPVVLRAADIGIEQIHVREEAVPTEVKELAKRFNDLLSESDTSLESSEAPQADTLDVASVFHFLEYTHTSNTHNFTLEESEQSLGTTTWLDLAILSIHAIITGSVMVVDELDTSLHPLLLRNILRLFQDPTLNQSGAQLIFSSHDITLLGKHPLPQLKLQEAWLVEKLEGSSELISWTEFEGTRDQNNIEQRYLRGLYGGTPQINMEELRTSLKQLQTEFDNHHKTQDK